MTYQFYQKERKLKKIENLVTNLYEKNKYAFT